MKFSKRLRYSLLGSLIFTGIALRYPLVPHEIGWDSFFIHGLINTLNHYGNTVWWIHPFSTFGLTPFSYASAGPVFLSGFSQASGLSIEISILLFGMICGIIGIVLSIIALIGGIFAIKRQKYGLALVGGICALLVAYIIFGLIGLILVAISKDEFT